MTARSAGLAAAVALTLTLAGCTRSVGGHPGSSGAGPTTPSGSGPAASDTSSPTQTSSPATATPPPSKSAKPIPPGPPTCAVAALSTRVLRGGAEASREIAAITFTNTSPAACTLVGYPGVSLRRNGALLGQPASRQPAAIPTVVLRPGEAATTTLTDFSTCQAPLSDTVRVYPPESLQFLDLPLSMRGCALSVDPVRHA